MFGHDGDVIGLGSGGDPYDNWFDHVDIDADVDGWSEPEQDRLPADLESIPPGPFLAAIVSSVDRTRLNGFDAVRLMQAEQRLVSHHEAGKLATMVEVAHSPAGGRSAPVERATQELEFADTEIAAALTLTRRAAESELDLALSLAGRLRRIWGRLRAGTIDLRKAKVFDQQVGYLDSEIVEQVLDRVSESEHLTTGQLGRRLAKTVMELDPEGVEVGYQAGLAERKVVAYPNPDHTSTVSGQSLPPEDVAAVMGRLNDLAVSLKRSGDERSIDQLRADIFIDLLLDRGQHTTTTGGTHLHVDLATLAELSDCPGEFAGYGPVIADIARQTALQQTDSPWTWTVTDDGFPIAGGTTRRRPDAQLVRQIRARYQTCTFPGCRMPSYECDLDHRTEYSKGGPTTIDNLAPLCRYHHMAKHHAPWELRRTPDGDHHWTSPLGHQYLVARGEPKPTVPRPPPKRNE